MEVFSMRNRFFFPLIIAVTAILAISCSGSPLVPDTSPGSLTSQNITGIAAPSNHLWGYWDVTIDPVSGTVDVVPLRGAEFKANVTMFLQPPAGKISNLKIFILNMDDYISQGLIDVEVTLVHPFPGLDVYTGFDVKGVFIHDGDTQSSYDADVVYARGEEIARLLNPDGYTRWYNPSEFTSGGILGFTEGALGNPGIPWTGTINPYKYFCDDLDADEDLTEYFLGDGVVDDRGLFSSTGSNTRLYNLDFPMEDDFPALTFQYAVIANWETPTVDPPMVIPDDFPESANSSEAFNLAIADDGSTLFYDNGVGGGLLKITAELFDWGAASNPDGILGEFSKIIIESPNAVIPGGFMEFTPEDFAPYVVESTAVSSVAMLELDGVEPTSADDVEFLIIVEGKDGETYNQGYPVDFPEAPLAGYWFFKIPVGNNPCANFNVTSADPASAESGLYYDSFTVYGENFQDGINLAVDIVDGVDILTSAVSVVLTDVTQIDCEFDFCGVTGGDYDLRVTNGCDPVSYASIPYTVGADPFKNLDPRPGYNMSDLGICEDDGQIYAIYPDSLIIFEDDYSTVVVTYGNSWGFDRIEAQREIAGIAAEGTLGRTAYYGQGIYDRDENYYYFAGYTGNMIDVVTTSNTRHYYCQNAGTYMRMSRRSINSHGGNITGYYGVGTGPGLVNMAAVVGIDTSRNLDENRSAWFYFLEGAPEFSVERTDYYDVGGAHTHAFDQTFFGTQGDGDDELNDPKDISTDFDNNVYILDVYSNTEPVVKIYDSDCNFIGTVGDSTTISGDPLRIECDESDGSVHVLHTDGISVFRLCELPI